MRLNIVFAGVFLLTGCATTARQMPSAAILAQYEQETGVGISYVYKNGVSQVKEFWRGDFGEWTLVIVKDGATKALMEDVIRAHSPYKKSAPPSILTMDEYAQQLLTDQSPKPPLPPGEYQNAPERIAAMRAALSKYPALIYRFTPK